MSFYSVHADRIWEDLYTVCIPDAITMNPDYVRKFGVNISGMEDLDKNFVDHYVTVKIPIIEIMQYFEEGIIVQVPSREDMILIHKNIDLYLTEWANYLSNAINQDDKHKPLIDGLDRLSKLIYAKAAPKEVIDTLFIQRKFGIVNPLQQSMQHQPEQVKPDYNSITDMLKKKQKASRF